MLEFVRSHQVLTGWLLAISGVTFVAGLIVMPIMIARMRSNYFLSRKPPVDTWRGRHPAVRISVLIVKNAIGFVLLLLGLTMLLGPGQGIITILVGISLLNLPGKRRLELWIVRRGPVLQAINWIRSRANRPPLQLPPDDDDD